LAGAVGASVDNNRDILAHRLLASFVDNSKEISKHVKTVLIVDDDLGFGFWLGQTLTGPAETLACPKRHGS
jgi:hypothetical protein